MGKTTRKAIPIPSQAPSSQTMAPSKANQWHVYLLRCSDGSLYCGVTNNIRRRLDAHNAGKGAKYTKPRRPVSLAYIEGPYAKSLAMSEEAMIKQFTKKQKEAMVSAATTMKITCTSREKFGAVRSLLLERGWLISEERDKLYLSARLPYDVMDSLVDVRSLDEGADWDIGF